jgi:hypothetical protein
MTATGIDRFDNERRGRAALRDESNFLDFAHPAGAEQAGDIIATIREPTKLIASRPTASRGCWDDTRRPE